jgi:aromatic-L-amino-acid/L-tryptophan decarboxylase
MPQDDASLELSAETMKSMCDAAVSRALEHLARVGEQPAQGVLGAHTNEAERCRAMRERAPELGAAFDELLDEVMREHVPRALATNGPGYMAYVPGGGIFPAALADLVADVTNRYTGVWFASPALVQLEANVLEWFREWMQFPEGTRGLFTTGGSMATFNAIVCARERRLGVRIREGVVYTSTQAHHSVQKSAKLAGIATDRVRALPVDEDFRMRVDALVEAMVADRRAGLAPFLVVSSAGTTNTGAVDPLDAIADVCAREGAWHHVDGAYGAFFHACEDLRPLLAGLPRADSLTLDPHKGLFLPYGTGALLVRDGSALRDVHAASADYLPGGAPADLYCPSEHGPDLSRGFPGLRVWLTLKVFGAARMRAAIAEKRVLAIDAAERIASLPGVVMVARPQLSLFAFHVTWPGASRADENVATREVLQRVAARGRVFLSGCNIAGRELVRVCVLAFRTRREHVEACVEDVTTAVKGILSASAGRGSARAW